MRKYPTPLGDFPSVTTIIEKTAPKKERDRLRKWQQKMDQLHGIGTANSESHHARQRGTDIHSAIEQFLKGEFLNLPANEYIARALPILKLLRANCHAIEKTVYHPNGYAGTLDLLATWEEQITIIDFTTSKRLKRKEWLSNKFLQCAAYAIAHNYLYQSEAENLMVIVLSPEKAQLFTDPLSAWESAWEKRLHQFWAETFKESNSDRANSNRS